MTTERAARAPVTDRVEQGLRGAGDLTRRSGATVCRFAEPGGVLAAS